MTETTLVVLGEGILTWNSGERRGDRYGLVVLERDEGQDLTAQGVGRYSLPSDPSEFLRFGDVPAGESGMLVAEVISTRESGHIGDFFHGFFPVTPEVGERIELGEGTLFTEVAWEGVYGVGVLPHERTRKWGVGDRRKVGGPDTFWLNPYALYRAHEQTVRLVFEVAV